MSRFATTDNGAASSMLDFIRIMKSPADYEKSIEMLEEKTLEMQAESIRLQKSRELATWENDLLCREEQLVLNRQANEEKLAQERAQLDAHVASETERAQKIVQEAQALAQAELSAMRTKIEAELKAHDTFVKERTEATQQAEATMKANARAVHAILKKLESANLSGVADVVNQIASLNVNESV